MIETGTICLKIAGREAGKYAVIVQKMDDNFVMISGPKAITGVKRRKCNIDHLEPTEHRLDIEETVNDSDLETKWKKSGLVEKLEIEIPVKRTKVKKEKTK